MAPVHNDREPDERLLDKRKVMSVKPDGRGFMVKLSCTHMVWTAVMPLEQTHCGECLSLLADQCRAYQTRLRGKL